MNIDRLTVEHIGQITKADIEFGDLTVLVGPQATGKSIFLEVLKLLADTGSVQEELHKHGADWGKELPEFLDLFLGEGMRNVWKEKTSRIAIDGKVQDLHSLTGRMQRNKAESMFLIPAQRVLTLRDGWPRPFSDYSPGDPFTVRHFSERLRTLMESELGKDKVVFPRTRRLKDVVRDAVASNVFGSYELRVEITRSQKRLVLGGEAEGASLPYMVWSAGQREFVPLLLGLYWLLPPAGIPRRDKFKWVVIEEPEMGLHPNAIAVVLLLVLDLLSRDYRVCISTHSPHVIDLVWAMQMIRKHRGDPRELLSILQGEQTQQMRAMASAALRKDLRVYYFSREKGESHDISNLDPDSDSKEESGWGGLSEFSGRVNDVVSRVVNSADGGTLS